MRWTCSGRASQGGSLAAGCGISCHDMHHASAGGPCGPGCGTQACRSWKEGRGRGYEGRKEGRRRGYEGWKEGRGGFEALASLEAYKTYSSCTGIDRAGQG